MANAFVWKIHEVRKDTMYAWGSFHSILYLDISFWNVFKWASVMLQNVVKSLNFTLHMMFCIDKSALLYKL